MQQLMLRPEEAASLALRRLYSCYGYSFYRMSRWEEYDFYADKKDFLISPAVLTFTDADGRMKALRPDVTLSIIKHLGDAEGVHKFFYDEKVYRVPRNANTFREIAQSGIECMGALTEGDVREVLELAVKSLETLAGGRRFVLDVAHAGVIASLVHEHRQEVLECLANKNLYGLKALGADEELLRLAEIEGRPSEVGGVRDEGLGVRDEGLGVRGLEVLSTLREYDEVMRVDFSAVNSLSYYNGIVFRGFVEGIAEHVLSGGQYDDMMAALGHKGAKAVGFAVNVGLAGGERDA